MTTEDQIKQLRLDIYRLEREVVELKKKLGSPTVKTACKEKLSYSSGIETSEKRFYTG